MCSGRVTPSTLLSRDGKGICRKRAESVSKLAPREIPTESKSNLTDAVTVRASKNQTKRVAVRLLVFSDEVAPRVELRG